MCNFGRKHQRYLADFMRFQNKYCICAYAETFFYQLFTFKVEGPTKQHA